VIPYLGDLPNWMISYLGDLLPGLSLYLDDLVTWMLLFDAQHIHPHAVEEGGCEGAVG